MSRKPYLEYSHGKWYAVRVLPTIDGGERRVYAPLHVDGKGSRRAAERAMREFRAREAVERSQGHRSGSETFCEEYAKEFLESAAIDVRPSTFRSYSLWIRRFAGRYGHVVLADVEPRHIEEWKRSLSADLAPATVNIALRTVRVMFGRAHRQRIIHYSPFDGVSFVDVPRHDFVPYWTAAHFGEMLQRVTSQRLRVGFCLAFYAGLRAREVVTLRWEDVGEDSIHVVSREDARTKSGRSRAIPLFPQLERELRKLSHRGQYVMASKYQDVTDERALSQKFLWHRRRQPHLPGINFHGLRHSFATGCALRGMPLPVLQQVMGHAQITTTAMYMHVQGEDAAREAKRYAPPED